MPVAHKMKTNLVSRSELMLLGAAIGTVAEARAPVRPAGPGHLFYEDVRHREAGEKLTSRFAMPPPSLPMSFEVLERRWLENNTLIGAANGVGDHAT